MIAYGIFSKTYCEVVLNSRIRLLLFQHMTYFLLEYLMIDNTETEREPYVEEMFDLLVKEEDEENMKLYKLMAYIVSIHDLTEEEPPVATDDLQIKKYIDYVKKYIDYIMEVNIRLIQDEKKDNKPLAVYLANKLNTTEDKKSIFKLVYKKLYPSKAEKPMIKFGDKEKEAYLKKLEKYMKDYRKMIK